MSEENVPNNKSGGNGLTPVVFERDGRIYANSRDVAGMFQKRHDNVMRDIKAVLAETGPWGLLNFEDTPFGPGNGQTYQSFDMTKNGFTYLVQGYTGAKVAPFKIAYIDRFDAMESALKNPLAGFSIPTTMAEALRLAADQSEKLATQARKIEVMTPKVDGFDRIANSDGMMNLTNAAKTLQVPPRKLTAWLIANRWIYRRPGGRLAAFQSRIVSGDLTHKTGTIELPDGTDKEVWHVQVTAKGLAKLALVFRSGEFDFAAAE